MYDSFKKYINCISYPYNFGSIRYSGRCKNGDGSISNSVFRKHSTQSFAPCMTNNSKNLLEKMHNVIYMESTKLNSELSASDMEFTTKFVNFDTKFVEKVTNVYDPP